MIGRAHHLALLPVHEAVAALKAFARPDVEERLAQREAARQRRWCRAAQIVGHTVDRLTVAVE